MLRRQFCSPARHLRCPIIEGVPCPLCSPISVKSTSTCSINCSAAASFPACAFSTQAAGLAATWPTCFAKAMRSSAQTRIPGPSPPPAPSAPPSRRRYRPATFTWKPSKTCLLPMHSRTSSSAEKDMSFADAFADVVISSAVLHFARDDAHFASMLHGTWRVLKAGGLFFCRLASSIGLEDRVARVVGQRFLLPDNSERYLVNEGLLLRLTNEIGGQLLDPLKTTIVQNQRSMTTRSEENTSELQ